MAFCREYNRDYATMF